jgi:Nucleotide-diphospho-sugar transferase
MICITTIVSANYLAYARALKQSVLAFHPNSYFRVLIVDRKKSEILDAVDHSGLEVLFAEELGIEDFEHLAFKYNLVELNTALKPTLLKKLLSSGFHEVIYLDPDIRVFADLEPIFTKLQDHSIILTPHSLSPIMDGSRPSDVDFLRNGSFNLGFIAVKSSEEARQMLDWWEDRCLSYGFNDLGFGTFVDQKWIDLVPSYFSGVHILKHPGCNVAYWNLHERNVDYSLTDKRYYVNGCALIFFHFSGVKAEESGYLSRHQNRVAKLSGTSVVGELVVNYCKLLIELGHKDFKLIQYSFGKFDNGAPISQLARRAICIPDMPTLSPFSCDSDLYRKLKKQGALNVNKNTLSDKNTMTYNPDNLSEKIARFSSRYLFKFIGAERFLLIIRFIALLDRESNLARVIFRKPFDFTHSIGKSRLTSKKS